MDSNSKTIKFLGQKIFFKEDGGGSSNKWNELNYNKEIIEYIENFNGTCNCKYCDSKASTVYYTHNNNNVLSGIFEIIKQLGINDIEISHCIIEDVCIIDNLKMSIFIIELGKEYIFYRHQSCDGLFYIPKLLSDVEIVRINE